MPVVLDKAHEVINAGLDVMIQGLREKKTDDNGHLRMKDAISSVNAGVSVIRHDYADKCLKIRMLQLLEPKDQKQFLPEIFTDMKLRLLDTPKKKK